MKSWKSAFSELRMADLLLIVFVLVGIAWTAHYFSAPRQQSSVYVYKDNAPFGVYPLSENRIVVIDEQNSIEIKDGRVRMNQADCPDKRCLKQGFTESMPIICLPNHLLIEIKSSEDDKKLILH